MEAKTSSQPRREKKSKKSSKQRAPPSSSSQAPPPAAPPEPKVPPSSSSNGDHRRQKKQSKASRQLEQPSTSSNVQTLPDSVQNFTGVSSVHTVSSPSAPGSNGVHFDSMNDKNTENGSSNKKNKATPKAADKSFGSGTGYSDDEDEFEDYDDDDFEEEEASPVKKTEVKTVTPKPKMSVKPKPKEPKPTAKGKFSNVGSYMSTNSSLSKSAKASLSNFNPAAKRINDIKAQTKLIKVGFTVYSSPPITLYRQYQSKLRSNDNMITESSTQFNEGNRSIGCVTDEVATRDEGCLCRNGEDDTVFEEMLGLVKRGDLKGLEKLIPRSRRDDGVGAEGGGGLTRFLEQASVLCESLCEENLVRANKYNIDTSLSNAGHEDDIFEVGSEFKYVGKQKTPFNQILWRNMRCVEAITSVSKGTMIVTVHVEKEEGRENEKPHVFSGKSVVCIWETFNTSTPVKVLVCDGKITKTTLGTFSHVVVAGKEDGSLCVWDLREEKSQHIGRYSKQLNMPSLPVRKPTYSTDYQSLNDNPHASNIVGICVDVNQVVSCDDRGMCCVWYIADNISNATSSGDVVDISDDNAHLGLGIGAKMKLALSRVIWFTKDGLVNGGVGCPESGSIGPVVSGLMSLPHALSGNTFVLSTAHGKIYSMSSFGATVSSFSCGEGVRGFESSVCGVSVNEFVTGLFLVGRNDGTVEIYKHDVQSRIANFDVSAFDGGAVTGGAQVEWSSQKPTVFIVSYGSKVYVMDLKIDCSSPVAIYDTGASGEVINVLTKNSLNVGNVWLVSCDKQKGEIKVREISKKLIEVDNKEEGEGLEAECEWLKTFCEESVC